MLEKSLRLFIKCLLSSCGLNEYELVFEGNTSGYIYIFQIKFDRANLTMDTVAKPKLFLLLKKGDSGVQEVVYNIDTLKFKDARLTPLKCVETVYKGVDELYESNTLKIHYPAQLYLKLFKLMKDRVCFVFESEGKHYQCYYVDGKVLYICENDTEYRVIGTNLFHLATIHPEYNILMVSYPIKRYSYGDYLDSHRKIANKKGKAFIKVIKDKVITEGGANNDKIQ